jgi:uncharacterized protein (TIGR00725 family)
MARRRRIAVIGSAGSEEYPYEQPNQSAIDEAEVVGTLIARRGCILLSGGLGGVMQAACRGAQKLGGITVGVRGGIELMPEDAISDVEIRTGSVALVNRLA